MRLVLLLGGLTRNARPPNTTGELSPTVAEFPQLAPDTFEFSFCHSQLVLRWLALQKASLQENHDILMLPSEQQCLMEIRRLEPTLQCFWKACKTLRGAGSRLRLSSRELRLVRDQRYQMVADTAVVGMVNPTETSRCSHFRKFGL